MTAAGRGRREEEEYRRLHYPGTDTPINKLNITDRSRLEIAERALVKQQMKSQVSPDALELSYEGFKALHRFMFHQVYDWAGRERTYTTGRGSAPFATPENIRPWMETQFRQLRQDNFLREHSPGAFAEKAAALVSEINAIHPFMDGNGRTQRLWLRVLGAQAGHFVSLQASDQERWYEASRAGFEKVDYQPMAELIASRIVPRQIDRAFAETRTAYEAPTGEAAEAGYSPDQSLDQDLEAAFLKRVNAAAAEAERRDEQERARNSGKERD